MLHGWPQSYVKACGAPALADRHTAVCADLRDGDSSKPKGLPDHSNYSKRTLALDMVQLMDKLGHDSFHVIGHDRGARVGHRLAADHRARVRTLTVIDISPTLKMYASTDMAFARAYYHWFLFIQPEPLPETMVAAVGLAGIFGRMSAATGSDGRLFAPQAMKEYLRCFDARTVHSSCEDYRASAGIDLDHDRADAGKRLACRARDLGHARRGRPAFDCVADWRGG
jgi:haloacetate dehalogenase